VKGELDEAVFIAGDPVAGGERREAGGGQALPVGLVAGAAETFAVVDLVAG
jgi:hypothetical protein